MPISAICDEPRDRMGMNGSTPLSDWIYIHAVKEMERWICAQHVA
jgi:hypothetical protein